MTARPWIITAAATTTLICLAGWPRLTLYTLGIAVGAVAILAGLRSLVRGPKSRTAPVEQQVIDPEPERCCVCGAPETPYENYRGQLFCWPCADGDRPAIRRAAERQIRDAAGRLFFTMGARVLAALDEPQPEPSGPTPDTARTDPDTTQHDTAGQGRHHPDTIRTRLAEILGIDPSTPWDGLLDRTADVQHIAEQLAPAQARVHALQQQLDDAHRTYDAADSLRYAMGAELGTIAMPPNWPPNSKLRRLIAGLNGIVRDQDGHPICTCTFGSLCPTCQSESPAETDAPETHHTTTEER